VFYRPRATAVAATPSPSQSAEHFLDFGNTEQAFQSKSVLELGRGAIVFRFCSFSSLIKHVGKLYMCAINVLGGRFTHALMRPILFDHFCAGEDVESIRPKVKALESIGVGSILDYAAEASIDEQTSASQAESFPDDEHRSSITARVYDYQSEKLSDANAEIFLAAVRAVKNVSPEGFAAVKISGLGNPVFLERMSTALNEISAFFERLADRDVRSGTPKPGAEITLSYEEFSKGWHHFFNVTDEQEIWNKFDKLDQTRDGKIRLSDWTNSLTLEELSDLVNTCKETGPLYEAALTPEELKLMSNLLGRMDRIVGLASELGVRVMIDAEWVAIQPAIANITVNLQRKYNTGRPVVFNTYQTYLRHSYDEVCRDMKRAEREGWSFGAKVVRGAYMVMENERAAELKVQSPVWDCYEKTEESCHRVIHEVLNYIGKTREKGDRHPAEIMIASHNQGTVETVVARMNELGIPPGAGVYFGQLLGMADHLTFTLGNHGYKAYKYVPYGPIGEVVPYLIRRTQENSTFLGSPGVQHERRLVQQELKRRMFIG
jgi:proline dehydrogenase